MRKSLIPALVLSAVAATSYSVLAKQVMAEQPQQPSLWVRIYRRLFQEKEPPIEPRNGGSRDEFRCMLSPDAPRVTRKVWSDRPLFIWQGNVSTVSVRPSFYEPDLWSQSVASTQSIRYAGKPLKPGHTYKWIINNNQRFVQFQILDQLQRDRISQDLEKIENQLKSIDANYEAVALAKANYFAEHNLWSDVLQQIYSVPQPSAELKAFREDITERFCNSDIATN